MPARIKADARTYSDVLRTTDALYNMALQEMMNRRLSHLGVTLPYIDKLCAAAFKKVAGKLESLPGEPELLELMTFAYQDISDPEAVVEIYRRLNTSTPSAADRKRVSRMYQVALVQAEEDDGFEQEDKR